MSRSYVVTGAGGGIGRALVERLLDDADGNAVVAIELDPAALSWLDEHPAGPRAIPEAAGRHSGWVNNAAVFRDASLHSDGARKVLDSITLNLGLAAVGCSIAVEHFLAAGEGGAIVNVSSHQAQRAVRGPCPTRPPRRPSKG